jgi:valyl-tRNA synthetase
MQPGKGFTNKIWNAFKLIKGWEVSETIPQPESSKVAIEWYEAKLQQTLLEIEGNENIRSLNGNLQVGMG